MYKDSLVKYRSRFLITTFLFVTRKAWTFIRVLSIANFLWSIRCTIILYCFAIHSITSISGSLSNVFGYVLALVVRLLGISYLVVEDGMHQGVCNDLWKKCIGIKLMKRTCKCSVSFSCNCFVPHLSIHSFPYSSFIVCLSLLLHFISWLLWRCYR